MIWPKWFNKSVTHLKLSDPKDIGVLDFYSTGRYSIQHNELPLEIDIHAKKILVFRPIIVPGIQGTGGAQGVSDSENRCAVIRESGSRAAIGAAGLQQKHDTRARARPAPRRCSHPGAFGSQTFSGPHDCGTDVLYLGSGKSAETGPADPRRNP
ncbi:hypothetical protein DESC_500130 [Desulfosarcina cetonica]|nr:hypothetical protein DESC_500130 [Desulfosarcina cetonica]